MPHPASGFRRVTRESPFPQRNLRVPGEGPQPCRVMIVGEKPGREESHRARPFIGISGRYLDVCLATAGIERSSIYVTNLVKEFTLYSKPSAAEIARDHDELIAEILACDPEIIGLVGGWAVEAVLDRERAEMDRVHGVPILVEELFGGELTWSSLASSHTDTQDGWIVLPMLHPANCVYSPEVMPQVLDDVLRLGQLMDGEIRPMVETPAPGTEDYRVVGAMELAEVLR